MTGFFDAPAGVDVELEGFCLRPGVPWPVGIGADLVWELGDADESVSAPGRLHLAVQNVDYGSSDFEVRHYDWVAPRQQTASRLRHYPC